MSEESDPGLAAVNQGEHAAALPLLKSEYSANGGSGKLLEGYVHALLATDDVPTAEAAVNGYTGQDSAWLLTARSEVETRTGNLNKAYLDASEAVNKSPCNSRAHLQAAILLRFSSMYASAREQLKDAHNLNTTDVQIQAEWNSQKPISEQRAILAADIQHGGSSTTELLQQTLTQMDERLQHHCHVTTPLPSTTLPMVPQLHDATTVDAWALDVALNGAVSRLEIDSGSTGLLISRAAGVRARLKPAGKTKYSGIGDKGAAGATYAYADSIKVGGLEFADCLVIISDRNFPAMLDGLIGTDVFSAYLTRLDFPDRKLTLSQLPGGQGSGQLETAGEDSDTELHDRYKGPEAKDFTPVYRSGHDLILNTMLNDKPGLMILDTGAASTLFNSRDVKRFARMHADGGDMSVRGLSGDVKQIYDAGAVKMRFANIAQVLESPYAINMDNISRAAGTGISGLIGASALYYLIIDLDYRDGLVRFNYDAKHGTNIWN